MGKLEERDYFTDYEILKEPYAFFDAVRAHGPVFQPPGRDYLIVTGFEEALAVLTNHQDFSAAIGLAGAAAPLPFEPHGSDITEQLEAARPNILGGDLLVNLDDAPHSNMRSLVNRLFTPSRLKANEQFITRLSEEMVRGVVARGSCDLIEDIATPFVTLVIADLLGVPNEDRQLFMDTIAASPPPGSLDESENTFSADDHPMVLMAEYFARYILDRQQHPRDDILTELATADYPDGTKPQLQHLAALGVFIFGAGQDTSAKLLGNTMRYIVDEPGLQDRLRADPSLIPKLLEEVLRLEGSTKQTARIARRDTSIGDLKVPAGTKVLVGNSAANRDPRRWEAPADLVLDRPRIREHLAFGRGKHVCAGAPLARVEVRVILEKFLELTSHIDLDEARHGPPGARQIDFEPSFIIRGIDNLHLQLTPAAGFSPRSADGPSILREMAAATQAAAAEAEATKPTGYTLDTTPVGTLLANPAACEVLERHFPGMTTDKRIGMAKRMTLRTVASFAPEQFTPAALEQVGAELAAIPVAESDGTDAAAGGGGIGGWIVGLLARLRRG